MHSPRSGRVALTVVMLLTLGIPQTTLAAKPVASRDLADITSTPRGQRLAAEAADRYTSYEVPTKAAELTVLESLDGTIVIGPQILIGTLTTQSADGTGSSTFEVGKGLSPDKKGGTTPSATSEETSSTVQAAASAYWSQKEQGCLTSLYVDSARLDSCYYIFQLINDGSSTKNYWTLRQKGTAFEYGSGLQSAWVSGERTPNTTSQTWVDWGPEQGHDGSCSTMNLGVSWIVSLSYSVTGCEKWIIDKTCNSCSTWIKATWDCNCWWGLDAKGGTASRAIAYQMLVSTSQTSTPRFKLGYGMKA